MSRPKLGDLLLEAGLIDEVQLKIGLEQQKLLGTRFGSTLLALNFVDENVLTAFLSKQLNMPCVSLTNIEITPQTLDILPKETAEKYHVVPVKREKNRLWVAMCDPMDVEIIEALEELTGLVVQPMVAPESSILEAIGRYYSGNRKEEQVDEAGRGVFPGLLREIEEMEIFGARFEEINDRLERIERTIEHLAEVLEKKEDSRKKS